MADFEVKSVVPRTMRPRSTPNAEINAQKRDEFLREQGLQEMPMVKDVPLRGYRRGGMVKKGSATVPAMCKGGKVISSRSF
jgi:hypothetical protein